MEQGHSMTEINKNKKEYDSSPAISLLSVQPNMNTTTNVLMQYTLGDLDRRSNANFWLALICLAVCATNIVLLILNVTLNFGDDPPLVEETTFHVMEFWTSLVYAITEALPWWRHQKLYKRFTTSRSC